MLEAAILAESGAGAMVAAAGCGKTQVIASAVATHGGGRELVLTHTHAGVEAMRSRLRSLGAQESKYHLDTIAGWALRLTHSFPARAALPSDHPTSHDEYLAVYESAARLLAKSPFRELLRCSYSGAYVDEYQDCTVEQHRLILAIKDVIPCRIVGDPLQGIFDFKSNQPVQWERDVEEAFENIDGPCTGHRWQGVNPELGEWLTEVRRGFSNGQQVDLQEAPVHWIQVAGAAHDVTRIRLNTCFDAARQDGTVVAIHGFRNQCYDLASKLKGRFSCVEAIDIGDLYQFSERLDRATGWQRAGIVLEFAALCMTKVASELRVVRKAIGVGRIPKSRKYGAVVGGLKRIASTSDVESIVDTLEMIAAIPGAYIYRSELLREMKRAVWAVTRGESPSIGQAAWSVRNQTRKRGRVLPRCVMGTTLLVKGLQFDHAIVLDACEHNVKNLYVALTRGCKTVTVISRERYIPCRKQMQD